MTTKILLGAAATFLSLAAGFEAAAQAPKFVFPVQCELGRTCEIQNYVDRDAAAGAVRDYRGGGVTYDAHTGTDIRIPSMAAQRRGVNVVAAADGKVLRARDGVADVSVRTTGVEAVANIGCGNALVIEHAGGLETQYCHLARGSIKVKAGDAVKAGQVLGLIGLSGQTEYPHLHFMVRKGDVLVDPFGPGDVLWRSVPAYKASAVLNTGFSAGPVTLQAVEAGGGIQQPSAGAPALVAFVRAINLKGGDELELVLRGPGGAALASTRTKPLDRNKAQWMVFVGGRRPPQGWPKGAYTAEYKVWRSGTVALQQQFRTAL